MRATCQVIAATPHEYTSKKGPVKQVMLTLVEVADEHPMLSTFDMSIKAEDVAPKKGEIVDIAITSFGTVFDNRQRVQAVLLPRKTGK